jgi:hypothetical protein
MRLAARVKKLERSLPPPVVGCEVCRERMMWFDSQLGHEVVSGRSVPTCGACGRLLPTPLKVIAGVDPGAI